jgi:hypothetical protein
MDPIASWVDIRFARALVKVEIVASKDQQVREVVEGMALGLVALGVTRVTSSKIRLEFAFSHAWRRWSHANEYPSIGRAPKPDNVFWIGVTKSERRNGATVVWWNRGTEYEVGIRFEGWTPEDAVDLVGGRPLAQWVDLSTPFRERLECA